MGPPLTAHSDDANTAGILGEGPTGVYGRNTLGTGNGIIGYSDLGHGVWGHSNLGGIGVLGESGTGVGVHGKSNDQAGVLGISATFVGVWGESQSANQPGVFGKGKIAGSFDGDVLVSGDIKLTGGDCAERFNVLDAARSAPGTVMVIDQSGALTQSKLEYDRCAAGVVAGAGDLRPGIILDAQIDGEASCPVALMGKVYCKVTADGAAIVVGDLLTSSSIAGHAMKASDPTRAFGAVIGKALEALSSGLGVIRILVTLQ